MNNEKAVIAVDFDGTITENSPYPIVGKVRPKMPWLLRQLKYNYGFTLVLNTCRTDKYWKEAIQVLKEADLYDLFDWEYLKDSSKHGEYGKIVAAFYLDDNANLIDFDDIDPYVLLGRIVSYMFNKLNMDI